MKYVDDLNSFQDPLTESEENMHTHDSDLMHAPNGLPNSCYFQTVQKWPEEAK